jgi:glutamine amidotransferase
LPSPTVVIVDTGVGNLFSIARAVQTVGGSPVISADPRGLETADRVVIPGVGSYASTMSYFAECGLDGALRAYADTGRPLLGICLGMQLLVTNGHEEGRTDGLGVIVGEAVPMPRVTSAGTLMRLPHIGWSRVTPQSDGRSSGWMGGGGEDTDVYFAHSYTVTCPDSEMIAATFRYGGHDLVAAVRYGGVCGVQFHPERSGPAGLRLLASFVQSPETT